jgi:NAD(P)H-nitrite reductase large subunit
MEETLALAHERVKNVVVVGGGAAAAHFVKAFADAGRGSEVCVISDEPVVPYDRTTLSKAFLRKEGATLTSQLMYHFVGHVLLTV